MPIKIKKMFEEEYGKKKGDRIFYAWENKRRFLAKPMPIRNSALVIKGKPEYVTHMYHHLRKEHPSTKTRMLLLKGGY